MKPYKILISVIFALMALPACSVLGDVGVKIAPYSVIERDGIFEVRQYDNLVLASTVAPDGVNNASKPFYKLFKYISGKNDKTTKIEMTAPVLMEQTDQGTGGMSFVLPAGFTLLSSPIPSDPTVELEEINDFRVAVISFSGSLTQDSISQHVSLLKEWISKRGFTITGTVKAAGYNPPFTLPFMRRNEVMISIGRI